MADAVTITINGVDRTHVIPFKMHATDTTSEITVEVTAPGTATAKMKIWDPNNNIPINDNDGIIISDPTTPGHNMFNGYVTRRKLTVEATYRWWELECTDLNAWLDEKVVGAVDGSYFLQDPPGTYNAIDPYAITQANDKATVQWLFNHYAPTLPVETNTFVYLIEPNLSKNPIRWSIVTLNDALAELANLTNANIQYWIDPDWFFHWVIYPSPTSLPGTAPGPTLRLFPTSVVPIPSSPRALTDGAADHTSTENYSDFAIEWDNQGWADSIYMVGSTTYTLSLPSTLLIGGSGWVNGETTGFVPGARQRILQLQNVDTLAARDSIGNTALQLDSNPVVRGECVVFTNVGGWFPGQSVNITNAQVPLLNANYMIQKATTEFLSGDGWRNVHLEWGDAPFGTIGLRRQAEKAHHPGKNRPRRPSARLRIDVSNTHPAAGGVVRVLAQMVDSGGNAWPVYNAAVTWSVAVYNTAGTNVTSTVNYTLTPLSGFTNQNGLAWTDLITDTVQTDLTYYVTGHATI